MRRNILVITVSLLLLILTPFPIAKARSAENGVVEYFADGSYCVTAVSYQLSRASSVSGSKTRTYHYNDGTKAFSLTVHGTFSYDGNQAVCTSSSYSHVIYENDWILKSATATKSGNTASATGTFIRKEFGITVDTKTIVVNLACDKNGNLS